MVKNFIFLLLFPSLLLAGEFKASVNRNQVALGESFTLALKLYDVSTDDTPSTTPLKQSFIIQGQQKSSNTTIVNGKFSSNITWHFTLIPQKEGEVTIPPLTIQTSEGELSSNPIKIQVTKRGSASESDQTGMTLTTSISNASPYINEPITYKVKLVSSQNLANIRMQNLTIPDAIVESGEEPKVYEETVDGINYRIVEFNSLITPLKAGPLTIPTTIIQGSIPKKNPSRMRSFFDDDFDPFGMMRGFNRLEPFALTTEETPLEVRPPAAEISPWIPATSLAVEEIWDDTLPIKAGEPLTRSFKIKGEGMKSHQLPSLKERQYAGNQLKIYGDKPETGDEISNGKIHSFRNETFTLIPQEAGHLTLPEITIPWWNLKTDSLATVRIPSRTLTVSAANKNPPKEVAPEQELTVTHNDLMVYFLIGGMVVLLLLVLLWGITLQRKINRLVESPKRKKVKTLAHQKPSTAKELMLYLQTHGNEKWHTPQNATLKILFEETRARCHEKYHQEISKIEKDLEEALYLNQNVDMTLKIERFLVILSKTSNSYRSVKEKKEKLPNLNTT